MDRLLASPHYGERWGRYWLDVARYAEDQAHTFGVQPNTNAWRYRDWVVAAFNEDMPYDRFVRLQIAADLIEKDEAGRVKNLPALGFFGLGAQYYKNSDAAKVTADELDDRVDTLTPRLSRPDRVLRPLPRSQVRSGAAAGLLFAGRDLFRAASSPISRWPRRSRRSVFTAHQAEDQERRR